MTKLTVLTLVLMGSLAACAPAYITPHGGGLRADAGRPVNQLYRAQDGRVFPTRAARNAYQRQLYADQALEAQQDNRARRGTRRSAALERERQRLDQLEGQRLRAERRQASAERAERQARREATRTRRAKNAAEAERLRRAQAQTRRARDQARQAALAAERSAARRLSDLDRINRRQQRVDNLAPRPDLAPAIRRKIVKYKTYRRKGENVPGFVTRIARAERRSSREGQSVAYWLNDANHPRKGGARKK